LRGRELALGDQSLSIRASWAGYDYADQRLKQNQKVNLALFPQGGFGPSAFVGPRALLLKNMTREEIKQKIDELARK